MELASLLAGEPWSDRPTCVHPVLAAVARAVNDRVSERTRAELVNLIPAMIGTAGGDLATCARLVAVCTKAALERATLFRYELEWAHRTAAWIVTHEVDTAEPHIAPEPAPWLIRMGVNVMERLGLFERIYRREAELVVALAIEATITRDDECEEDRWLAHVLKACVAACQQRQDNSAGWAV